MIVKITDVSEEIIKKGNNEWAVVAVSGEKANGDDWKQNIFNNKHNKDAIAEARELDLPGWYDVKFEKNGKYWNLLGFKPTEKPTGESKPSGKSNSGWQGRTGDQYNRSAAIYLAREVIAMAETDAALHKRDPEELLAEMIPLANKIDEYISKGIKTDRVDEGEKDDPLSPPDLD